MFTAFLYQLLVDLLSHQRTFTYPAFLRDLARSRDIRDFRKAGEFWDQEVQKIPLNDQDSIRYFFFIIKNALLYYFYRNSPRSFQQIIDLAKHRIDSLNKHNANEISVASWEVYISLLEVAFHRIMRHIPIESYEAHLDQLDWDNLHKSFIPWISSVIGYTYLKEEPGDQQNKSRLWFFKALHESPFSQNIANYLFMAEYYLHHEGEDQSARIEGIVDALKKGKESMKNAAAEDIVQYAIEDLEALFFSYKLSKARENQETYQALKEILKNQRVSRDTDENQNIPDFVKVHRAAILVQACKSVIDYLGEDEEKERMLLIEKITQESEYAINTSQALQDNLQSMRYRLMYAKMMIDHKQQITEKELKEIIQYYRKQNHYPAFIEASKAYAILLTDGKQPSKALDVMLDVFKLGNKNFDEGGFYLLYSGLKLANDVFLIEAGKPGVSWIVSTLDIFFAEIRQIIDKIDSLIELAGKEQLEAFRYQYLRFDEVANFNIKVYFRYQLYAIKLLHLGNLLQEDQLGQQISQTVIDKLEHENNPLNLITADWEDFKDIPNDVRNKTLNRCINISKGDLPLAAEHLDFSYRNLRSYITFQEVNRLGFFLDLQETDNRQLEQGIRYIFYDLYKKGTIFEVVFDMPKFLVKYSRSGFYSQDLEDELHIKGTTAKKYIKIMIEIGLIRQDKTTGRKHYYRLIRENVMKRLGREQDTLID